MQSEKHNEFTLRELIRAEFTAIKAEVKASNDMSRLSFKSLKEDIELTHKKLDQTNGKVLRLEDDMKEVKKTQYQCPVHILKEKTEQQEESLRNLDKQTEVVRFFTNRPKLLRIAMTVMLIMTLFSLLIAWSAITEKIIPVFKNLIN